jgi:hypothetical protein
MKRKIMLIAGCSHAAGSEIDGTEDSEYNRDNSFGNRLAKRLGYEPVNIALNGSTNQGIARSILDWVHLNYDASCMELYVVIAWTDNSRMEIPSPRIHSYDSANPNSDFFAESNKLFLRINFGWKGEDDWEKEQTKYYHEFMVKNSCYLELLTINLILQIQYFLNSKSIKYVMCDTMVVCSSNIYTQPYTEKIDSSRYYNLFQNDQSFWIKYKNAGYTNTKAKYWHHNEIPHRFYAEELYQFITSRPL